MIDQSSLVSISAHMLADGLTYESVIQGMGRIYNLTPSQRVELRKGVSKLTQDDIDDIVADFIDNH